MYILRRGEKLSRQENAIVVVFTFYGKPKKSVKPTQGRTFTKPITRTDTEWLLWPTPVSLQYPIQYTFRRTPSQQKCLSNSLWFTTIMAYCIDPKHV